MVVEVEELDLFVEVGGLLEGFEMEDFLVFLEEELFEERELLEEMGGRLVGKGLMQSGGFGFIEEEVGETGVLEGLLEEEGFDVGLLFDRGRGMGIRRCRA